MMMVESSGLLTSALSKQNQEQKEQAFTYLASLITRSLAAASEKEKMAREGLNINTANHLTSNRIQTAEQALRPQRKRGVCLETCTRWTTDPQQCLKGLLWKNGHGG